MVILFTHPWFFCSQVRELEAEFGPLIPSALESSHALGIAEGAATPTPTTTATTRAANSAATNATTATTTATTGRTAGDTTGQNDTTGGFDGTGTAESEGEYDYEDDDGPGGSGKAPARASFSPSPANSPANSRSKAPFRAFEMKVVHSVAEWRALQKSPRLQLAASVGLVPTMGALHAVR